MPLIYFIEEVISLLINLLFVVLIFAGYLTLVAPTWIVPGKNPFIVMGIAAVLLAFVMWITSPSSPVYGLF